ncbi:[protein-PII] uridylyltransferase [Rhizosaccharibacter radicis]|uniref:Bifunctional uridylyltransferase/uridylyl-removing enzyme n=1 Tax=Rhizosaccharibacter radicis TaxID=2782605 RepID=A0ABT1VX35_9PROT|nr:[protein-PII] uridylyltransferase [Acetobacteraceae bacterium KSS12]
MPERADPLGDPDDAARLLAASLARAADADPTPREAAVGLFRRHLARMQQSVRDDFEAHRVAGEAAACRLSELTDGVIRTLYDFTFSDALVELAPFADGLAVAATGGYGRGTLAPFSDIDLLFLTDDDPPPALLGAVEFMLYFLWDLGLKVGHATRSVRECIDEAADDTTVRTTLLDARRIAGDETLFAGFQARYIVACVEAGPANFIADKQRERSVRHGRYGESPFLVEPNIKEGRGGLRDMQTLYWLCRYTLGIRHFMELAAPRDISPGTGEASRPSGLPGGGLLTDQEANRARRCWDFLWTVRFHLHYIAGRAEERLTFDMQPVVGARMGYTRHGRQVGVERFMRHYFLNAREVMRLTHVLEPAVLRAVLGPPAVAPEADADLLEAGFVLADGQILPGPGVSFEAQPIAMLRMLLLARDRNLLIHPLAMHALIRWERRAAELRGDAEANRILISLVCGERPVRRPMDEDARREARHAEDPRSGARWLHVLNETGLLGRLIPPWSRIVGQMQFDTYHVFTVDEHTIEAVRILGTLEAGLLAEETPVANDLVLDLQSRRALYLATLMHDIAKGRGGDHSELGSEMALELCPMLGLSAEETETVSWLVLHHLLLSQTAFRRDIDDPKTILDIADTIQSPERLRLLLILTVVDMRAVSPKVWNNWKATLLRELYTRVAEVLAGGLATAERDVRVLRAKEAAALVMAEDGLDRADIDRFLDLGYGGYWLSFDPETHARHARMIRDSELRDAPLTVETQPLPARAVTEVTVYAPDHAGLFSRIAGALAMAGASIVDARIHTMTNGMALDTFWVQDASDDTFDAPHRLARLSVLVEQALSGRIDLGDEIAKLSRTALGRRMRAIHVPPRVVIDNRASNTHTVIEVNGRDRPGLLHDVTGAMNRQGLQIASAHITTYGVRAVDVFYVKDVFGLKIGNERKLDEIREALLLVLRQAEEAVVSPAPVPVRRRGASVSG